ncbi:polysaccharide biosynthesis C-terminal domain-containing protein [Mucilaginibacter sp. CAU 1740]|uniref:lipopolysaccharide biosynthesis protein n=1 Tax=Mucilaginibacter sp. CAU 1740 TaxID=3140365 RepID=UPI00325B558A
MNLLQKQGFLNSLILYAGVALGFFNLIILFQRIISIEEIGFFILIGTLSQLYAQFAGLGVTNIILKYFPYYRTDDKKHGGFITFVSIWSLVFFTFFTILFVVFKNPILDHYKGKQGAVLLQQYFYYLIPLSFFTLVFAVLEGMALTVFKNVLSSFLREVVLRLFSTIGVLLIALKLLNYNGFLLVYIIANAAVIVTLFIYIAKGNHFKFSKVSNDLKAQKKAFLSYGLFTVLSNSSFVMIQNLDTIMLSALTKKPFLYVGIYGTFFAIAVVISMPAKALSRTSLQIIAQSWANNDLAKIGKIYYKTSVVQMLIGCLLFVGLVSNKPFIITLLTKHDYKSYFDVFIVVGVAFLVDMTGGINGYIINMSKYYRLTTVFIVSAVVLCGVSNWILIPRFNMMGAALAYLITMFVLNFVYWLFIKIKFDLQPFGKKHFYILLMFGGCLLIGLYLPHIANVYLDMIYRSLIIGVVYAFFTYILKISEDINLIFDRILKRGN